jgi:signal transduction histidine kinase
VTEGAKRTGALEWPAVERRKDSWATDWQTNVERDKATIAQSLHDNTGGLLVAAVMDITWAEKHLMDAPDIKERLSRARAALDVAIDLNRRMIEDLRPTLLDNFGLIPALKWHFAEACKSANVQCESHLPEPSPVFLPGAAIGLYRIAQTLIAVMVSNRARALVMTLTVGDESVTFQMRCEGMPASFGRDDDTITDALASVTGRIKALGGTLLLETPPEAAIITCRLGARQALE